MLGEPPREPARYLTLPDGNKKLGCKFFHDCLKCPFPKCHYDVHYIEFERWYEEWKSQERKQQGGQL